MRGFKHYAGAGTDWAGQLAEPDLSRNLGKLLQTYREAPPERREEALLAAMREIKQAASSGSAAATSTTKAAPAPQPLPTPASATPPFEPDIISSNWEK